MAGWHGLDQDLGLPDSKEVLNLRGACLSVGGASA